MANSYATGRLSYLFIAGYDSMNQPMAALIRTIRERGGAVEVVANNLYDKANLNAFSTCGVAPTEVSRYDFGRLDGVDVVVMAPVRMYGLGKLVSAIRERGIFIVSFASLFSSVVMREYPDLVLALGESKFEEFARNGLSYNMVAVGNPQYDRLVQKRRDRVSQDDIEHVLVIDQGAYPYGMRGKKDLANTLMRIAQLNPRKKFFIKPRFYPQLKGRKTHEQSEGILDFIEELPRNLVYLSKPAPLEELIEGFDAAITLWSTAHLDAALYGIPLILISGLDSVDVFDVRVQRAEDAYRRLEATGCVHDFRELQSHQVEFSYVDETYLAREVYRPHEACGNRIVDVIELAYQKFVKEGRRPAEPFKVTCDEFFAKVDELYDEIDSRSCTWGKAEHDYFVALNRELQQWVYVNRCLARVFDMRQFCGYFDLRNDVRERDDAHIFYDEKLAEATELWRCMYDAYFSSPAVACQAREDVILQDFYFDWLREQGFVDKVEHYKGPVLAEESLAYNRARIYLENGDTDSAFGCLQRFLDLVSACKLPRLQKNRRALQLMKPFMSRHHLTRFAKFALSHGNVGKLFKLTRQSIGCYPLFRVMLYIMRIKGDVHSLG